MQLSKEQIAEILKTVPGALNAFEDAYTFSVLDQGVDTGNLMDISAKQVKDAMQEDAGHDLVPDQTLTERIVAELMLQSEYIDWNGKTLTRGRPQLRNVSGDGSQLMSLAELEPIGMGSLMAVPEKVRPQLSGNLMKLDVGENSFATLVQWCSMYAEAKGQQKKMFYNLFRQGLDILDLDPGLYAMLSTNKNAMSNWLPALVRACEGQNFFKIPKTRIVRIPMPLLQLTRLDYDKLTRGSFDVVDRFCYDAFELDEGREYFVKTGTYSSKFDFRNCHVHGAKEVRELGEYLVYIQNQAVNMAGPIQPDGVPSVWGVSTTNEWVVREYIPDPEHNPTIYKGLPLRTEYRVFIDCDTDQVLGKSLYWEPEMMKKRFGHSEDSASPHQTHDYITYLAAEERLTARYAENVDKVTRNVEKFLPALDLKGQWALDIMQSGDDFWLIDMSIASRSALKECIPEGMLKPELDVEVPKVPPVKKPFIPNFIARRLLKNDHD